MESHLFFLSLSRKRWDKSTKWKSSKKSKKCNNNLRFPFGVLGGGGEVWRGGMRKGGGWGWGEGMGERMKWALKSLSLGMKRVAGR